MHRYLAGEYGIDFNKKRDYENWLKTHQPFHWFIEFYGIVHEKGGFDVIIGNPPYVEYNKVKSQYTIKGYQTESCGNLYAFVVERSKQLLKNKGFLGMIVPISLPSTPRMAPVRDLLNSDSQIILCSNFADRPGSLFTGVHQKLSIVISNKDSQSSITKLFTTSYNHWYSKANNDERETLMSELCFTHSINSSIGWVKAGNLFEHSIFNKIRLQNLPITNFLRGSQSFALAVRMMYWGKSFTSFKTSKEYKHFQASSIENKKVFVAVFNSSIYFWFWELISDCWHITAKELNNFMLNVENLKPPIKIKLCNLVDILMEDLDKKKSYVGTKQTDYEYYHKLSKPIIDEIDCVLARHYGFTEEELDFIVNYDIKYRMGRDNEGEDGDS